MLSEERARVSVGRKTVSNAFTLLERTRDLESDKPSETGVSKGLCGAATRSRTRDLMITNQLLYQLSYSGIVRGAK